MPTWLRSARRASHLPIRRVFPEAGTVREARKMKILHCTAQSFFGRLIAAALSLATCTHTAAADEVANVPAPSPDKLERITDFFTNEVATGKLPGAVVLIQQ